MRPSLPHLAALAVLAVLVVPGAHPAAAGPKRALFDMTHAETAGNADWQIDTDQPLPLPAQSAVTQATLTAAYGITYGNAGNPYDLSLFDVFIVDEPNTVFTAAESTAIFSYVRDGGGMDSPDRARQRVAQRPGPRQHGRHGRTLGVRQRARVMPGGTSSHGTAPACAAQGCPPGLYFIKARWGDAHQTRRVVRIR